MPDATFDPFSEATRPRPTGNVLVVFKDEVKPKDAAGVVERVTRMTPVPQRAGAAAIGAQGLTPGSASVLEKLKIGVIRPPEGTNSAAMSMAFSQSSEVLMSRPEFLVFEAQDSRIRYANWVREGLRLLIEGAPGAAASPQPGQAMSASLLAEAAAFQDNAQRTWGLAAVGCDTSDLTGRGIRTAVLDTGFDLDVSDDRRHPDFDGRRITHQSFVAGQAVKDVRGHGTHCVGSAAGPLATAQHPRYGVATEADIFIGKVLSDSGFGGETDILAGIEWAISNQCEVISMSLGRPLGFGEELDPNDPAERAGQRALAAGCLIIAAAGNDSHRPSRFIAPVSWPAAAASIMAVAAVDSDLQVASFSNGGINPRGGGVDIAGPGVAIFSSFPMPERYKKLMGTSMATPHVAGVAALWAQSDPSLRGETLWRALERSALEIGLPKRDVGAGLVQAPPRMRVVGSRLQP